MPTVKESLLLILLLINCLIGKSQTKNVIPFELTPSGHILMKAEVNGISGNFIFDTGAGLNLFFKDFAKKLEIKDSYNFFVAHRATGEAITTPIYYAKDLKIGNRLFKDQLYSTFDLTLKGIDGLISLQAFQDIPVIIDYQNKTITLHDLDIQDKSKYIDIQIANYADKAIDIFTNIRLNDHITIQVALDAGAGKNSFWIHSKFMETLRVNSSQFEVYTKKSEFDSLKTNKFYIGPIESIKTLNNTAQVKAPKIFFVEGLIYEGKTSIDWLGKKIAISLPEKKIFILD